MEIEIIKTETIYSDTKKPYEVYSVWFKAKEIPEDAESPLLLSSWRSMYALTMKNAIERAKQLLKNGDRYKKIGGEQGFVPVKVKIVITHLPKGIINDKTKAKQQFISVEIGKDIIKDDIPIDVKKWN